MCTGGGWSRLGSRGMIGCGRSSLRSGREDSGVDYPAAFHAKDLEIKNSMFGSIYNIPFPLRRGSLIFLPPLGACMVLSGVSGQDISELAAPAFLRVAYGCSGLLTVV